VDMARYHVTLFTTYGEIGPDELDAPDLESARARARDAVAALLRDGVRSPLAYRAWVIVVTDDTGTVVARMPVSPDHAAT
jgi:hypothetical protein